MSTNSHSACNLNDPAHPRVKDVPTDCCRCGAPLCLRKQVVNLALGNTEQMYCLQCISEESQQSPAEVLDGLKHYIDQRDCFKKEWLRYESVEFCPDRAGCIPDVCFSPS
jgi:hypothetical protein